VIVDVMVILGVIVIGGGRGVGSWVGDRFACWQEVSKMVAANKNKVNGLPIIFYLA
jgi:hypothetical protein